MWLGQSLGTFIEFDDSGWRLRASPVKGKVRMNSKEREEENKLILDPRENSKAKRRLNCESHGELLLDSGGKTSFEGNQNFNLGAGGESKLETVGWWEKWK